MSVIIKRRFAMVPGSLWTYELDFGENTDGQETGMLNDGDTVSSVVVSFSGKPSGADDPTAGSVTVGADTRYINGRQCSAGEWAKWTVTTASDQSIGEYMMKIVATTANGNTVPLYQGFSVIPEPS